MTYYPSFSFRESINRHLKYINIGKLILYLWINFLKFRPRFFSSQIYISPFTIYYRDSLSLYMELKDIFIKKIYHFYSHKKIPFIIDGGSFIGVSILYFKLIYPKAKIFAFEPDRLALSYLLKNIKKNKLQGIKIFDLGLSNSVGEKLFTPSGTDSGKLNPSGLVNIKVDKLSNFIKRRVDYLKLNIEGAEYDVIRDLDETGKINMIDQLCIEWHSFEQQKQNLDKILKLLTKNNFKYLINHFDYESNRVLKPPFELKPDTRYYLLIYAKNLLNKSI